MADNRDQDDRFGGFARGADNIALDWLRERLEPGSEECLAAVKRLGVEPLHSDEVWSFGSPAHFWKALAGRAGNALVRDGKVGRTVLTFMN